MDAKAQRAAFYGSLGPKNLAPLWEVLRGLVPPRPATPAIAALWRYEEVRPYLQRAGELISAEEAERRVLILENPAMPGQSSITRTLYAGLQLLLPGETARCHRHTQSALRFIMEGEGAFTAVDGEKAYMSRGDLILTPSWRWHDHGNPGSQPVVWLDGLDIPLIMSLDAGFAEHLPGQSLHPQTRPPGDTLARHGSNLRPIRRELTGTPRESLFVYPYSRWREALEIARRHEEWDGHEGLRMEFIDPQSGTSAMNTMSAFAQLVPKGFRTRPLRSTDGTVYVVVEGSGSVVIQERELPLQPSDIFVVPSWHARSIAATQDLVLFSFSDRATQQKLALWREELLP